MPLVVRGLASQDAAAFTALVERSIAAGELLGSSAPHGEHLVEFSLAEPQLVGVAEDDGALVGWVHPEIKALAVEPDHRRRGIGRALVDLGLRMEAGRGRPNLILGALPGEEPAHSFVGATGFELHSLLWDLELPPEARLATPEWPAGVATRPVRFADDRLAFIRLFNAAFADHATPLQMDEGSADDPPRDLPWTEDDLLVAEQGGELIGFAATEPVRRPDGGVEPRAEIWTIGVRPDRQGAGLGRQLLRWGVGHLRELGARDVVLSVNGRNPRALGLYESEGFVRTSTRERWARPVSGAG